MGFDGLFLDSPNEQSKINANVLNLNGFSGVSLLEQDTKLVFTSPQRAVSICDRDD
jgi:hypothetical protein